MFENPQSYMNELLPRNSSPEKSKKKKGAPAGKPSPATPKAPPKKDMKEEMDYLAKQRAAKDRQMRKRRAHDQKQHPLPTAKMPPVPPVMPHSEHIDPITGKPLQEGEAFDMMAYMKK